MKKWMTAIFAFAYILGLVGCSMDSFGITDTADWLTQLDNTQKSISIPQKICYKDWAEFSTLEEHCPYVLFNEDKTCQILINTGAWTFSVDGIYCVYTDADGHVIIKVAFEDLNFGDGYEHEIPYVYFTQLYNGEWKYYGDSIGLSRSGTVYEATDNMISVIPKLLPVAQVTPGVYRCSGDEPYTTLTVPSQDREDIISFDIEWHRLGCVEKYGQYMCGNLVFFEYNCFTSYGDKGYAVMEVGDKTVQLALYAANLTPNEREVAGKLYTFGYVGTEEECRIAINKESLLCMQNEQIGWCCYAEDYPWGSAMFIRFEENGTLKYWIKGSSNQGYTFDCTEGIYQVGSDRLFINGDIYELYTERTGATYMHLEAVGPVSPDLSGSYYCQEDDIFAMLYQRDCKENN